MFAKVLNLANLRLGHSKLQIPTVWGFNSHWQLIVRQKPECMNRNHSQKNQKFEQRNLRRIKIMDRA